MDISGLKIDTVVIHEVFKRGMDKKPIKPTFSNEVIELDASALSLLQTRMTNVLGEGSKSMEMDLIGNLNQLTVGELVLECIDNFDDSELFIEKSKRIVNILDNAQQTKNAPGGIIIVIKGEKGRKKAEKFLAIIKAELDSGFVKEQLSLKYIPSLVLTPHQKLYKIGMFTEISKDVKLKFNERLKLHIYDNNLTRSKSSEIANYFYKDFLSSTFSKNDKVMTREFYNITKEFIDELEISVAKKVDLNLELYQYINSTKNLSVNEFSEKIPGDYIDSYKANLFLNEVTHDINKDSEYVNSKLKNRKIHFANGISIISPSESFENNLEIEEKDGKIIIQISNSQLIEQQ